MKYGRKQGTFLGTIEQHTVLLDALVDTEDAGTRDELHDGPRGDDGRDAQLHQGATVGCHDHTHPVESISSVGGHDAIKGNLGAHQEDEQYYCCPEGLLPEKDLSSEMVIRTDDMAVSGTLRSGWGTSGRIAMKGRTRLRTRTTGTRCE